MATKRKAAEAFSKKKPQQEAKRPAVQHVSAFAAAKARQAAAEARSIDVLEPAPNIAAFEVLDAPLISRTVDYSTTQDDVDDLLLTEVPSQPMSASAIETTVTTYSSPAARINSTAQDAVEVSLPQNAFVTILGEYGIAVASGSVSIYGAVLHPKSGSHIVYAYSTHALPRIVASSPDTLLSITSKDSQDHKLAPLSPLFRNISTPHHGKRSFLVLDSHNQDTLQRLPNTLEISKQYQTLLTRLAMKWESGQRNLAIACIGGKSSGKSTFARHACNKLLSRTSTKTCFYLDLDPGQPEFGPPGQVYLVEVKKMLFGPSYTHFATRQGSSYRLVAAHSMAATTFRESPQHYMDCIKSLFDHRQLIEARQAGCPVVINTGGWVNDLGARVLIDILQQNISDAVIIDTVDTMITKAAYEKCQDVHELTKPANRSSPRSPGDLRQMQTMAYFHCRHSQDPTGYRWVDRPISSWRPWLISYADAQSPVKAIVSYVQSVGPEFLSEVLNGALVALISANDDISGTLHSPEGLPYLGAQHQIDPRGSEYHGLALVRGIDVNAKQIQLVTPLDDTSIGLLMQKTVVLVRGSFDNPDWAYLSDIHHNETTSSELQRPWVAQREMTGIEGAVWRLRHPPTASTRNVRG